jgi:DNA modification methylase
MTKQSTARRAKPATDTHRQRRLEVISRPISDLTLEPTNPRIHSRHQIRQIARSIEAFGFLVPVLIDRSNHIVAGHGRILAGKELGLHEVPTIRLEHLTEAQVQAFRIADNRLCEIATWDDRLLGEQLKALAEVNLDFSLEVTGFQMAEIDLLIEGTAPATEGKEDPADRVPESSPGPPVCQWGDRWQLDRHQIVCGNALDETVYTVLLSQTQAAMVFIDPPYNVQIPHHAGGLGRVKHPNFIMASGEMSEAEFTTFLTQTFTHLIQYTTDGALIYVCIDWRHMGELLIAGRATMSQHKNVCVWDKGVGGMGSFYRSQHELVFVFKHGTAAHRNNIELGQYGRYRTNIWKYPGVNSFGRASEEGNLLALHPTVKPVALVADAILDASARHDIVLDAFLGSGTTLLAAERTGRICYGMELDPHYVDTAIRRWQRWTGQQARHAVSGRLFDDLVATGRT